jgi:hypothetical protein
VVIEPTEFSIFGITISREHIDRIRKAMENTYADLSVRAVERPTPWPDTEFCKRQIVSLWGGIVEMLSRVSEEQFQEGLDYPGSQKSRAEDEFRKNLAVDRDNQDFLKTFGEQLMSLEALGEILPQLEKTEVDTGSIRVRFKDTLTKKTIEARIEVDKMLKQIKRESGKIETGLKHFVEWVKNNKRAFITCSLVAGLLIISIVAMCFIGAYVIPLIGTKLFIMASLAIACVIYEIYGTFETLNEVRNALSRRVGLSLREL